MENPDRNIDLGLQLVKPFYACAGFRRTLPEIGVILEEAENILRIWEVEYRYVGGFYTFELSHSASLLASILPTAAIKRQTHVRPPMMYNHWLLLISAVQE